MNNSIYRFTLDIHKTKSQVSIPVLFHDTAIQFYISLTDGGKPYYIENGCRAVFSAKKPDGTDLFNDCIIEDNTRIRYDFTKQTTNCEGIMNCEVRLYGTDGHLITTPAFVVVVDPRVIYDSDIIESHPESTALDTIISSELARLDAEADRVDAENARIAAEITRINEETERDDAEDERVAAEAERKANEAERMAAYASMIGSWVAYSLYPDGTDYTWEWSEGQRYIGLCNGKTPPKSKEDFVWSKFVDTGVYVGSGEMPEWCDLQIDPEGDVTEIVQTPGQSTSNMMSQKAVSDSFANALKGSASGEVVALNDVSPIEHELGVSVRSKNLLPYPYTDITKTMCGITFTDNGDGSITANGTATDTALFQLWNGFADGAYLEYSFGENFPTVEKNAPVYHGFWELGCYNRTTKEYLRYDKLESYGHWANYDGCTWDRHSGFGIHPHHPNYKNFGGNIEVTHNPCICFKAPINGRVRLFLNEFDNVSGWHLYIYVNDKFKGSYDADNYTIDQMNDQLAEIDITLSKGDFIYFVAVRTGENWSCKMMPCVVYISGTDVEIDPVCVSGCPAGGSKGTYYISDAATGQYDIGRGFCFIGARRWLCIIIKKGYTANNLVFLPMIENGRTKTEYVPYIEYISDVNVIVSGNNGKSIYYPVRADGTVQGVKPIYPNTTLLTDTAGAVIDCEYNRDTNKVLADLITRLEAVEAAALN